MTDTAMSRETMLAALSDLRLPPEAAGGLIAEIALALATVALAALLVLALRRLLYTAPRPGQEPPPSPADPAARRIALLHLLKARAPDRFAALHEALYRPDGVTLERIEAEAADLD